MKKLLASLAFAQIAAFGLALPAHAAGAIVESPQNIVVWYTHASDPGLAVQFALDRCTQEYGPGCHVRTTYVSGCMAIATAQDGTHRFGYAIRPAMREASLVAIGNCAENGTSCRMRELTCE